MKIKKLQEKLQEENLEAYLATENAHYLSETRVASAALITKEGSLLLCNRLNLDRAEKESVIPNVRAFANSKTPLREEEELLFGEFHEVLANILREREVNQIGFDLLKYDTFKKIRKNYEAEYIRNPDLIWDLRKTKTEKEIEMIKKSGEIASKGMKKAAELIEPGRRELQIAAEIEYEMRKLGSEGTAFDTILASGENSRFPHIEPTDRKLKEEELVIVDLGAQWKGYKSDMTRTFAIYPNSRQKKILEITKKAQEIALNEVKANIKAKRIDETARKVFREENYEKFYLHGTGHGVGLNIHEPPTLNASSGDTLKENMIITVEPGIYIQNEGGVRFEDTIIVKNDGYEKLTQR